MKTFKRHLTVANVLSCIALFVALSGVSYAFATGSIGSREIRNGSILNRDFKDGTLRGQEFKPDSLGAPAIKEQSLDSSKLVAISLLTTQEPCTAQTTDQSHSQ